MCVAVSFFSHCHNGNFFVNFHTGPILFLNCCTGSIFLQDIILVDKPYLRIVLPDNFFLHILQLDNFFPDNSVEIVACGHNYEGIDNQVYGDDVTENVDNEDGNDKADDDNNFCMERYQGRV